MQDPYLPCGCSNADIDRQTKDTVETQTCEVCSGKGRTYVDGWMERCPTCKGEGEVPVTPEDVEDRKADVADHARDVDEGNKTCLD